jgi:hypothetical protein
MWLAKHPNFCDTPDIMKALPSLLIALLAASAALVSAQPEAPPASVEDTSGPNRFWQANVGGGHYMVALDRISSISRHRYVLDGSLVVNEVTIDSTGQALARFYFIAPLSAVAPGNAVAQLAERGSELLKEAGQRAGTNVQNMVVKKYPDTTHARTVEYRLLSEEQLTALYASLQTAWESGRGRRFTAN